MRALALAIAFFATQASASDWAITEVNGVATIGSPTISFDVRGISGSTGCNGYTGQADVAAGVLRLEAALAMTRRACGDPVLSAQENSVISLLRGEVALQPNPFDGSLTLVANGVTARLLPGRPAPAIATAGYVVVSDVDATLNIRADATTEAGIVTHAPLGMILHNNGCEDRSDRTWCKISFIDSSGSEGWAAAEFLSPATAVRRAGGELFDQIGRLICESFGSTIEPCDYGVARASDGSGAILIYLADNHRLLLEFRGTTVLASGSDAADRIETEETESGVVVTAGTNRVTIPHTVLLGG